MVKQEKSGNHITTTKNRGFGYCVCGLFLLICLATVSCKNKKDVFLHAYENKLGIKPSKLAQIDTLHFTTIEWENTRINFGKAKEGDSVTVIFRCRNTGENPLFLSEIYSPCGCTIPHYTEKVILPGELEEVPVLFHTKGQDKLVKKKIIVTSNTSNGARHTLLFEGEIVKAEKPFE